MAWKGASDSIVISDKTTKAMIADKAVDVDDVQRRVLFFAKTRTIFKECRGLTYTAAKACVDAQGAQDSRWKLSRKIVYQSIFKTVYAEITFESFSRTTSLRRVDDSGQYCVTTEESTTETDGEERPIN